MPNNRTLLILIGLSCFAILGAALYLQHFKDMLPCPYCVIQRYAYFATAIFCLTAAAAGKPKVWAALALASTLTGIGYVARHLWVLAHPGLSCGIDPLETALNKTPMATYLPWIFQADGLCSDALDKVLGLSVPQWSAAGFAVLTVALLIVLFRRT